MTNIKDMFGILIGATIGSAAIQTIGNAGWGAADSLKGATQSIVGVGVLSSATKLVPKGWFK